MAALGVAERSQLDEAANLVGVVVLHCCLQVLALRRLLPELPAQPAQEAHGGLVRHEERR